jgi:hypothetical protein
MRKHLSHGLKSAHGSFEISDRDGWGITDGGALLFLEANPGGQGYSLTIFAMVNYHAPSSPV